MATITQTARSNKRVIVTGRKKVITLIYFFGGWAIAIICYLMGIRIGKRMAEQEFEFMRQEMQLDKDGENNGFTENG